MRDNQFIAAAWSGVGRTEFDAIYDIEILPSSYSLIRKDRGSHGGGVMLAVHNFKPYKVLSSPHSLEVLTVSIGSGSPTIYCLVYIPPNSFEEYLTEFFNYLQSFSNVTNDLMLLGDFNFDDINWDSLCGLSPASTKFCDIIFNLNLLQLICEPTHIAGNMHTWSHPYNYSW